jgi:hypothetical protein
MNSNCIDQCLLFFQIMVWKTSAANFGGKDIRNLCVNSVHRPNSTEYFPLSVDMFLANARFSAFKLYRKHAVLYSEVNANVSN